MGSMGREQESSVGGGGKSVAGRLLGTQLDSGLKVHARSVGRHTGADGSLMDYRLQYVQVWV